MRLALPGKLHRLPVAGPAPYEYMTQLDHNGLARPLWHGLATSPQHHSLPVVCILALCIVWRPYDAAGVDLQAGAACLFQQALQQLRLSTQHVLALLILQVGQQV